MDKIAISYLILEYKFTLREDGGGILSSKMGKYSHSTSFTIILIISFVTLLTFILFIWRFFTFVNICTRYKQALPLIISSAEYDKWHIYRHPYANHVVTNDRVIGWWSVHIYILWRRMRTDCNNWQKCKWETAISYQTTKGMSSSSIPTLPS